MNREIKFRAWDKRMGRMLSDATPMRGSIWWNDGACFDSCGKEYDVMQFTGLLDKDGKEVYEGDVVKVLYTDWPSQSPSDPRPLAEYLDSLTELYEIAYRAPEFVGLDRFGDVGYLTHGTHGYIEVVGNIYEKPALFSR